MFYSMLKECYISSLKTCLKIKISLFLNLMSYKTKEDEENPARFMPKFA